MKQETTQQDGFVQTECCKGKLKVVYETNGYTNNGGPYPAFFYCSICFTASDGNANIIDKKLCHGCNEWKQKKYFFKNNNQCRACIVRKKTTK